MKYFEKVLLLLLLVTVSELNANVSVPEIFGSHMVLQQKQVIHIWGWADPKEKVTVQFADQKKSVTASANGEWKIDLQPLNAGGPFQMIISGKNQLIFDDVMIGEVWLCSGQSNMEFALRSSRNANDEILQSNNPLIRHIKIHNTIAAEPLKKVSTSKWKKASPETSGDFTAVGYYFAKEIQKNQNVAVGIINSTWGGTYAEAWISHSAMIKNPDYAHIPQLSSSQLEGYYSNIEKKVDATFKKLGLDPGSLVEQAEEYIKPEFDDSRWMEVNVPEPWDKNILPGFDGVAWYRRTFEIPAEVAKSGVIISLGKVEDNDVVFVNGQKVGSNNGNKHVSTYSVAPSLLKEGKNTLTVRVEDYWEAGGFTGLEADIKVSAANGFSQSLAGTWKMSIGKIHGIRARTPNVHPNVLYNAMIAPLIPYGIKGVLWYQGESNAGFAYQYRQILPALIGDWRQRWNQGDFPFYIVQLTNYNKFNSNTQNGGSSWAELRESQYLATKTPNVDIAVITDVGDSTDIHPVNKETVGKRLSLLALKKDYANDIVFHSPVYKSVTFSGNKAILEFDYTGSGLIVNDRYKYLRGFEIAGKDKQFYYAQARIENNKVVVYTDRVNEPVAVRYSWSDNPDGNLFNAEGLPVMPFRTDEWELTTQKAKFNIFLKL